MGETICEVCGKNPAVKTTFHRMKTIQICERCARGTPATIRRNGSKVGRNDPCPCGSGKKHKKCCGKPRRPPTPRPSLPQRVVDANMKAVRVYEHDVTEPQYDEDAAAKALIRAGVPLPEVYAFQKLGRLITQESRAAHDEATLAEWDAAIEEYHEHERRAQGRDNDESEGRDGRDAGLSGAGPAHGDTGDAAGTEVGPADPVPDTTDAPAGEGARAE